MKHCANKFCDHTSMKSITQNNPAEQKSQANPSEDAWLLSESVR